MLVFVIYLCHPSATLWNKYVMTQMSQVDPSNEGRDDRVRRLEREWQKEYGQYLLDTSHKAVASSKVFEALPFTAARKAAIVAVG